MPWVIKHMIKVKKKRPKRSLIIYIRAKNAAHIIITRFVLAKSNILKLIIFPFNKQNKIPWNKCPRPNPSIMGDSTLKFNSYKIYQVVFFLSTAKS
jgi:hypothetical protein